ncbi:MAG: OsmC family protein [Polyangiales bacterium]
MTIQMNTTSSSSQLQKPQTLNGLDPAGIAAAVAEVSASAEAAQVAFRARTTWLGSFRSRTDIDSYDMGGKRIPRVHRIDADEPLELLGANEAPNPQDLILAALNACMTVGFVVGATSAGLRIDSLEIESECPLDLRGVFGLDPAIKPGAEKIRYTIRVKGSGTREQFEEVHRAMQATSPNRFHLTSPIPLESSLIVD